MQTLSITTPDDFHLHVRDGELMRLVVPHCLAICSRDHHAKFGPANRLDGDGR
jgi:dihydroorotase